MNGTKLDWMPLCLVPSIALLALPMVGSVSTWLTLTMAGLAMGMIVLVIASGLTLVFGLMDVMNFGHGLFVAIGAFVASSALVHLGAWTGHPSVWANVAALAMTAAITMAAAGTLGIVFERLVVRPVYGNHLNQILITVGGLIVGEELIKAIWGPDQVPMPLPSGLQGSWYLGDVVLEKYRVLATLTGLIVYLCLAWTLTRTKIGLLVRAGVEDLEMVESLGYRVRRLFAWVFAAGSALAGLGGLMWGMFQQNIVPQIGAQVNVLIFIVIIIGGLGSTSGALIGALLVGVTTNYVSFLAPKAALLSSIVLMVLILCWRPQGVYPVAKR